MRETMDKPGAGRAEDLSALAWVQGELRRSLEAAHKSLRRYLKEAEAGRGSDVDALDASVLRTARAQLHQGAGALELVAMPAVADVLRASEAAVQHMASRPGAIDTAAVDAVERASFAVLDFIGRQLAGKPVCSVALFPQYRAVLQRAGADRIHPADLWKIDWRWRDLPHDDRATPRSADDDARGDLERLALALMRDPGPGPMARMSDLCADLGAGARGQAGGAREATLWQLAAAVFQAQAQGLLAADVYAKRVASRLLAQLRTRVHAGGEISDRLAQDLLFFCSHARSPGQAQDAPRLAAVRQAWNLDDKPTADYEMARLGRFDPAVIALARKRVAAARDAWSAVAGSELHRLSGLADQFELVGDSLQRLFPGGEILARALQAAARRTVECNASPPPALAMEVATAILYLDASLEDGEFDDPAGPERLQRLAWRIGEVRSDAEPRALDSWMEELYRRVSDRQTLGSVVHELRASLSEVEKQIDLYFRDPAQRDLLIAVPAQLSAMRGVLSVLGMDQASQAALHMRDEVDALAQTEVEPHQAVQTGTFDRLADNLGALSFLVDMLAVQPQLAKSLFRYDPESGTLSAVMGQSERVSAFAAFDGAPAAAPTRDGESLLERLRSVAAEAARGQASDEDVSRLLEPLAQQALAADQPEIARLLAGALAALRGSGQSGAARLRVRHDLSQALARLSPPAAPEMPAPLPTPPVRQAAPGGTGLEDDPEMRDIFIDEARELVAQAGVALVRLADRPEDSTEMTAVRRAFHTLKGSARMVGLPGFGQAAFACEQLYNARLAQDARMDEALAQLTAGALGYLADWTEAIATGQPRGHAATDVAGPADALRLDGQRLPIALPASAPRPAADVPAAVAGEAPPETLAEPMGAGAQSLAQRVPDLPSAADLDLGLPGLPPALRVELPQPEFDLDLGSEETDDDFAPAAGAAAASAPVEPAGGFEIDFDLDLGALTNDDEIVVAPAVAESAPLALPGAPAPRTISAEGQALAAAVAHVVGQTSLEAVALPTVLPELPELPQPDLAEDDPVKVIGELRVSIPLFNIYLNEADELSRRLNTELAEWALEHERHPVPESTVALAHSLAGSSSTVGYADLSALARQLESALMRSLAGGAGRPGEPVLFNDAAGEIRRLLHQFAAGFLRPVAPELIERLAQHEHWLDDFAPVPAGDIDFDSLAAPSVARVAAPVVALPEEALPDAVAPGVDAPARGREPQGIEAQDAIDGELLPIFEEEAEELLPQLQTRLRAWRDQPAAAEPAMACMRTLHTLKGGARLAGAMRLGEMAHRLETTIEGLAAGGQARTSDVDALLASADAMNAVVEALRLSVAPAAPVPAPVSPPAQPTEPPQVRPPGQAIDAGQAAAAATVPLAVDWGRFAAGEEASSPAERPAAGTAVVRVRAALLDRMVNQAGELSITRSRIDSHVKLLQVSLGELTESLGRLRRQLRDIELQAETQITTRMEAAKAAATGFDPLEMDRFTRFQELTRFMAESVNDVATLQRSLQRSLQSAEDELAAQARLARDLQDDLLRTRMVEFESLADRLHRAARQAAAQTGKQVDLEIVGGGIEMDRGVLERLAGPFEHLLRNAVAHGVETPAQRERAGKNAAGRITVTVAQSGNEVAVEFADDGAGLDLQRIRRLGIERGLLAPDAPLGDDDLTELVFTAGFSTAGEVTELAGRGVGLDVVRAEVTAMGGRIETASEAGRGTRFRLLLPLTTAVTQVVMLRCGEMRLAVPSPLVEVVRRVPSAEVKRAYADGHIDHAGQAVPFFWLAALLQPVGPGEVGGRTQTLVVVRSAARRVAVHVDEVLGNQEVVVKNIGPQLARLPGLAGVTLLPSGAVALIYNPVALASLYGGRAHELAAAGPGQPGLPQVAAPSPPLVMVVDDSLTVRRVTQRLLVREGYRVVTAKDGLEALELLAEERPVVLLSDIEMPRMDGFDLLRNVRADRGLAGLPVVMITSRTAQKHRDHAAALGANHYLGKPYAEEELLAIVTRYMAADIPT